MTGVVDVECDPGVGHEIRGRLLVDLEDLVGCDGLCAVGPVGGHG